MYVQQQQQPGYYQQPQVVQMQPMQAQVMYPPQQQQVIYQQQPQVMMQPQVYVQPQVMVQQPIQPVLQIAQPLPVPNQAFLPQGNQGTQTPGTPPFQSIDALLNAIKGNNTFTIRYMDTNFRPEGGYKFGIYGRDKSTPFAHGYANTKGDASIELTDFSEPFAIVQVKNTSAQIYNLQTGQRDMFGTVALNRGSCGSFQVAGESNGNRVAIFQNRQFSLLFCCCCSLLYLSYFKCCNEKTEFTIVNGDDNEIGTAKFKTDNLGSYREVDINLSQGGGNVTSFVLLEGLLYMAQKMKILLLGQGADVSFEF